MIRRLLRLFDRFCTSHLALETVGPEILGATGSPIGRISTVCLQDGRLILTGQVQADMLTLKLGSACRSSAPGRESDAASTFRLEVPYLPDVATLHIVRGAESMLVPIAGFSAVRRRAARLLLLPNFLVAVVRAFPAMVRWSRDHDIGDRERVKMILGLGPPQTDLPLDLGAFAGPTANVPSQTPITIVMPVFNGFDLLEEVLRRVLHHTDLPFHLVVIEDASSDPRVRPFLEQWSARHPAAVTLILQETNFGFIAAVNRGFTEAARRGHPVVILNADAFVPPDWASRLIAPLFADTGVASVTPMSNDAELACVPVICAPMPLPCGAGDAIDAVARRLFTGAIGTDAPTGVGFCMAISPRFLAQVPGFDPVFGKGYGEEVDWCQKVRSLGGRHIYQPGLFVEHHGGASFGAATKKRLLIANGARVSQRYPHFDTEVRHFIADDPLVTARLALGIAWAAAQAQGPVSVYLGHALGGGAEHDLARRVAGNVAGVGVAVVLRVGKGHRWTIELHTPGGITRGGTSDRALVVRLLSELPQRHIVYSCGVGDIDPLELPLLLLDLLQGEEHSLHMLFHDYFPISPSFTLLDADGVFRGVPQPSAADRAHQSRRPDGRRANLAEWQEGWGALIARADRLEVFSQASAELVRQAYPSAADRIQVMPHQATCLPPVGTLRRERSGRRVIGVLGNIGAHKGAQVVSELSARLARSRQADLVLVGNIDPAYRLARGTLVHGDYVIAEIPALIARYGISGWLIPSIWPETYSFTTHEALATRLPVVCFDLGAQADAVRAAIAAGAPGAVVSVMAQDRAFEALRSLSEYMDSTRQVGSIR